jgi:hypothetical protein
MKAREQKEDKHVLLYSEDCDALFDAGKGKVKVYKFDLNLRRN